MNAIDLLIGRSISENRRLRGLSHDTLGRRVGLSAATVAAFEDGRRRATAKELLGIAEALDLQVEGLFGRVSEEPFDPGPTRVPAWIGAKSIVGHYDSLSLSHRTVAYAFLIATNRNRQDYPPRLT